MLFTRNIKMAIASLKATKVRSFLTMLGVIIGVSSVLIAVSVGEGVKNQVVNQVSQLGDDVITIIPGNSFVSDSKGHVIGFNSTTQQGTSTLTSKDLESLQNIKGITAVSPDYYIGGMASTVEMPEYNSATIVATTPDVEKVLKNTLDEGQFFSDTDKDRKVAVLGNGAANDLFNQPDPIGRVFDINGESFIVRGVLRPTAESPLNIGFNYNTAIYIPIGAGEKISSNPLQVNRINIKLDKNADIGSISSQVESIIEKNHQGQKDFTVINQQDFLQATDQIFELLTGFIAGVAAISLFVGGVGIMNIMLVSVSERTREIGVRKAVGATNRQIINQFIIEAIVLSVLGGIFGIIISFIAAYFIKLYTSIVPSLSLPVILMAFGVSVAVGIIFGIAPAIKAATKDPIESLRHT